MSSQRYGGGNNNNRKNSAQLPSGGLQGQDRQQNNRAYGNAGQKQFQSQKACSRCGLKDHSSEAGCPYANACPCCLGNHPEHLCPAGSGGCYQCGSTQHTTKSCPAHNCSEEPRGGYHFDWECRSVKGTPPSIKNNPETHNNAINARNLLNLQQKEKVQPYQYALKSSKTTRLTPSGPKPSTSAGIRFGSSGTPTFVIANYVQSTLPKNRNIHEYDLSFGTVDRPNSLAASGDSSSQGDQEARKVEKRSEKERVMRAVELLSPLKDCADWATNYEKVWTLEPLELPRDGKMVDVVYKKPNGQEVTLSFVSFINHKAFDLSQGPASLVGGRRDQNSHHPSEALVALNAIVSRHVVQQTNMEINPIGFNKFFVKAGCTRMDILDATRGYYTSVRPGYDDVLININTATSAFYHPMIVSAFMTSAPMSGYEKPEALLKNRKVRIMYSMKRSAGKHGAIQESDEDFKKRVEQNRQRTIAGFGFPSSQQRFNTSDGPTTVQEYFQGQYGIQLRFPNLPAVNVGLGPDKKTKEALDQHRKNSKGPLRPEEEILNERASWVPPELLELEPDQPFARKLNPAHTTAMLNSALQIPAANQHLIENEGLKVLNITAAEKLGSLQMEVGDKLIQIPARLLRPPQIVYKTRDGQNKVVDVKFAASWNVEDQDCFFRAVDHPIHVVDLRNGDHQATANNFIRMLSERMKLHNPAFTARVGAKKKPDINNLSIALQQIKDARVVFVIVPDQDSGRYAKIKAIGDRESGIQTICVTHSKLAKPTLDNATLDYLALKFNMKLGGQNHKVRLPAETRTNGGFAPARPSGNSKATGPASSADLLSSLAGDTMVVGADVTHPTGGAIMGCPSIAAVVASTDNDFMNYPGSMRLQEGRKEMIDDLKEMLLERLDAWSQNHEGKLPNRIIFYRDGVSESQYDEAKRIEMQAIRDAVRKRDQQKDVQIIFIVCGKRHNTRFFPAKVGDIQTTRPGKGIKADANSQASFNGNVKPGLVVDKVISCPPADSLDGTFDFFLQSHAAVKGTARSCHYVVLANGDEFKAFTADQLQQITHALCYSYATATKGISQAAPAYYADKLCTRGRFYLTPFFNDDVRDRHPPMPVQQEKQTIEAFRQEMAQWVAGQSEWKMNEVGRTNPWHKDMDGTMFYL